MKIAILPGDGIGTEIVAEAVKVLNALDLKFEMESAPVGGAAYEAHGHPLPESTLTWNVWSHTWRPAAPGRYQIVLRITDPTIRTRRLDLFFYVREIVIDES